MNGALTNKHGDLFRNDPGMRLAASWEIPIKKMDVYSWEDHRTK